MFVPQEIKPQALSWVFNPSQEHIKTASQGGKL